MTSRHPLVWVLGIAAFVMSSALACSSSSDDPEFEFGEKEMTAAVLGTWQLTYARPEGVGVVTFTVAPGPAKSGALPVQPGFSPQCGNRTFTRPAAACITTSTLELAASILEADPTLDATEGKGTYTVYNTVYTGGQLELSFGTQLRLSANLDKTNSVQQSDTDWQGARVTSLLHRDFVK